MGTLRDRLADIDAADPATVKPADRKKVHNKRHRTRRSMAAQRKAMIDAGCWLAADKEAYQSHMAEEERRRAANHRRRGPGLQARPPGTVWDWGDARARMGISKENAPN